MNGTQIIQHNYHSAKCLLSKSTAKLSNTSSSISNGSGSNGSGSTTQCDAVTTRYEYDLPVSRKHADTITYDIPLNGQYISEFRIPYNMFFIKKIELHITKKGNEPVICNYPITRLTRHNGGACMGFPRQLPLDNVVAFSLVIQMINNYIEPQSMKIIYGLLNKSSETAGIDKSIKLKTE